MQKRSKLEQILTHIVNEENEQAQKLFHDYIVERARSIHEELMEEENNVVEDEEGFDAKQAGDEVEFEQMMDDDDLDSGEEGEGDSEDQAEDELEDEMGSDESDSDEGDEDLESKIQELENELEDLRNELEELEGQSEEEGQDEEDQGDEDQGDEDFDLEGEDDEDLQEMEDYTSSEGNANRRLRKTNRYGSHEGDPLETDHELTETGPGDEENVNRVSNAGYKKADPMTTDWDEADGPAGDHEFDDSYAYDDSGWPGKPMSTESIDEDDFDIFDSLDESALEDLETVDVKMGGEQGGGKFAGNETQTDSPIPQKEPAKRYREDSDSRLTSKQDQHDGFEREKAPNTEHHPKYSNVRDTASSKKHGYDHVEKGTKKGDSKLQDDNEGFGDPQTTSPIGSKGTAGNKNLKGGKK